MEDGLNAWINFRDEAALRSSLLDFLLEGPPTTPILLTVPDDFQCLGVVSTTPLAP
jgi:hypothetical protein